MGVMLSVCVALCGLGSGRDSAEPIPVEVIQIHRECDGEWGGMVPTQSGWCSNSKHWFTTSFLQPLPYLVTGSWKLSANEQFFGIAQTAVTLLRTAQIKQGVSS